MLALYVSVMITRKLLCGLFFYINAGTLIYATITQAACLRTFPWLKWTLGVGDGLSCVCVALVCDDYIYPKRHPHAHDPDREFH